MFASASKGVSEGTDALNEFIAVFTSVRATTRESAETIATGLRTIFTRIQRGSTINYLKEFCVELQNAQGQFVGAFEAIRRLSEGLKSLDPRDVRFSKIVEELGGFRQIGKVIPLIQQFKTAQEALNVAQSGQGSLTKDAIAAQKSYAVQITRVREEFNALIRDFSENSVFKNIAGAFLSITKNVITIGRALAPIGAAFAAAFAITNFKAITSFFDGIVKSVTSLFSNKDSGVLAQLGSLTGGGNITVTAKNEKVTAAIATNTTALNSNTKSLDNLTNAINAISLGSPTTVSQGGKITGFNTGGVVPGSGNRDSVPAMLTPGEVVINKRAAQKYGRGNLVRLNKYSWGGKLSSLADTYPSIADIDNYEQFEDDIIKDKSKFIQVKPTPKDKADFRKMKGSSGLKFERFIQRKHGLGNRADGKYDYLDFPGSRSEAKFLPIGETYSYSDKGNTPKSIAAKNFLFENSYYRPNTRNKKVKEIQTTNLSQPVDTYWSDPSLWAMGGLIQKFANGGIPQAPILLTNTVGAAIFDDYGSTSFSVSADEIIKYALRDRKNEQQKEADQKYLEEALSNRSYIVKRQGLSGEISSIIDDELGPASVGMMNSVSERLNRKINPNLAGGPTSGSKDRASPILRGSDAENFGLSYRQKFRPIIFEQLMDNIKRQGSYPNVISTAEQNEFFDFTTGLGATGDLFPELKDLLFVYAKTSADAARNESMSKKIANTILQLRSEGISSSQAALIQPSAESSELGSFKTNLLLKLGKRGQQSNIPLPSVSLSDSRLASLQQSLVEAYTESIGTQPTDDDILKYFKQKRKGNTVNVADLIQGRTSGGLIQKFGRGGLSSKSITKSKKALGEAKKLLGKKYSRLGEGLISENIESRLGSSLGPDALLDEILSEYEGASLGEKAQQIRDKTISDMLTAPNKSREDAIGLSVGVPTVSPLGPNITPEVLEEAVRKGEVGKSLEREDVFFGEKLKSITKLFGVRRPK